MENVRHLNHRPDPAAADGDAFTRVPPHNLDAEQAVLGGMLLSRDGILAARTLNPTAFYRPAHETIFRTILDLHAKDEPVDPIMVAAELVSRGDIGRVGGTAYLHVLVQAVPSVANVGYYADVIAEHAVRRRVIEAAVRITQLGYDGDLDEVITTSRKEIETATEGSGTTARSSHLADSFLAWDDFFATDFGAVQLLPGRLMAPGQQITIVGDGKAGKSLFTQEWLWRMATGQSFLGDRPQPQISVLYVDAENGWPDVQGRFISYGAGPGRMGMLTYASFPPIRPLDTPGGGADLMAMAAEVEAQVVCIDTVSRFISGPENESDTWLSLYRNTLLPLKRAGIGSVRLDHLGKDSDKGARGSSAKTQDVDHVWTLAAQGGGNLTLRRTHTRTGIGPDHFRIVRQARRDGDTYMPGCTRHVLMTYEQDPATQAAAPGTDEHIIARLNDAGVPLDAGNRVVKAKLAELQIPAGSDKVARIVKARQNSAAERSPQRSPEAFQDTFPGNVPRNGSRDSKDAGQPFPGNTEGTPGTPSVPLSPPSRRGDREGTPEEKTSTEPLCTICTHPIQPDWAARGYTTHLGCDPTTSSHPAA
ncbi:DnaB-like helicase N-terminal domain-containing protein [Streptomyces jumonjinensis]|uniref:Replicative DNA helicase DnaB n=1 Tax=Streptomyces jumonjinensis TaxID=1945 RepID=A0A646KNL5_STRJU|nr:DnaB-like helicase N-terminal domain-containing protein [Streptomyces jumonjinensis]MQT03882.1 hypothetical protein [Streptomyces jumonjinensis]